MTPLYILWQRRNEAKSTVSTGCYPVDTITSKLWVYCLLILVIFIVLGYTVICTVNM